MSAPAVDALEDIDVLDEPAEPRPCEHRDHGHRPTHHADGGECWVRLDRPCGCCEPEVVVFCAAYIAMWASPVFTVRCTACGRLDRPHAFYTVLGPVTP